MGVIVNNHLTWKEHLHGESWRTENNNPGLIPQLSQRLGIIKKLSKYTSKKKLKMLISGLFYSKLSYCLPLFSNSWGLDNYKVDKQRFTSFTMEDNRKLQVLQNQVCRLLLDKSQRVGYFKQNLSTKDLLHTTGYLSIHQLGALSTVVMVKKILLSGKPSYLADRLTAQTLTTTRSGTTIDPISCSLNLKRSSFLYRGTKIFNQLPDDLRTGDKIRLFKKESKLWVKQNIPVKP